MDGCDAVLIPGGGVRAGGVLPPWVTARLDRAIETAGEAFLMPLSAGSPHRAPPLDEHGFPWSEARAAARYLVAHGAAPERILMEEASYDTIGNAYFSRTIHVIPRSFERVRVITSAFHLARTEAVFEWVYGLAGPGSACGVVCEAVADAGLDAAALSVRGAKEQASLRELEGLRGIIRSLEQLHDWLFTEHRAYAWMGERPAPRTDAETY